MIRITNEDNIVNFHFEIKPLAQIAMIIAGIGIAIGATVLAVHMFPSMDEFIRSRASLILGLGGSTGVIMAIAGAVLLGQYFSNRDAALQILDSDLV